MIKKVEVRKRLAKYEDKIREENKLVAQEMMAMKRACRTKEMMKILQESNEYTKLHSKWETLNKVLNDIIDIRCEKMFNDY